MKETREIKEIPETKESECDVCQELCEHPKTVCIAKNELLAEAEAQSLSEIFRILGDVTRVKILQVLSKRELCVCDIAAVINMSSSAVSHQLRLLRSARLVKYRKSGKMALYSLDDDHVVTLLKHGIEHVQHD